MPKKIVGPEDKEFVYKSNKLIWDIRSSLNLREQQIFYLLLLQVDKGDTCFRPCTFTYADIVRILKIKEGGTTRDYLKKTIDSMADKHFWHKDDTDILIYIIGRCEIDNKNKKITLQLDETLEPFLLGLERNYTSLCFEHAVSGIQSRYTLPLYEYLRSQAITRDEWEKLLPEAEVRDILNCSNKYPKWAEFRRNVVGVAVKEINQFTDIDVNFEYKSSNKQIEFSCKFKPEARSKPKKGARHPLSRGARDIIDKDFTEEFLDSL